MSWTRIRAIFVKELRDYRRNRAGLAGPGRIAGIPAVAEMDVGCST